MIQLLSLEAPRFALPRFSLFAHSHLELELPAAVSGSILETWCGARVSNSGQKHARQAGSSSTPAVL